MVRAGLKAVIDREFLLTHLSDDLADIYGDLRDPLEIFDQGDPAGRVEAASGWEAQKEAVRVYLNGGSWQLVDEVTEVESGKCNDRPKFADALRLCRPGGRKCD